MPYVSCPTCGERGKIPSSLIGARIKCRKCGLSFQVSPPTAKATAAASAPVAAATAGPSAAVEAHGIEVEGLDASSWALPTETAAILKTESDRHANLPQAPEAVAPSSSFAPTSPPPAGTREYKLLTPKDKVFDGRFDLPRLEEALNNFARQGWVAKSISTPHVKGFSGALEETIVVLLERCKEGP
jgi:hypothetical protein